MAADEKHQLVTRQSRFETIIDTYDALVCHSTHTKTHSKGRYVVMVENDLRSQGYSLARCDFENISDVAMADFENGWQPVCYFDLDELAGDEPLPDDGDKVLILKDDLRTPVEGEAAGPWYVVDSDKGSSWYRKLDLAREPDGEPQTWHHADHILVIERAEPDDRMPVRYELAKIIQIAVFNTLPSPA